MDILMSLFDFVMHIDQHLSVFVNDYGVWVYAILFLIIFLETGVVVAPFLPGDSLLFAAGMLAAQPNNLNIWLVVVLLIVAAILGDTLNYSIGNSFGNRMLTIKLFGKQILKEEQIEKTHSFYEKYGSKAIVVARFLPIVRTLAPFVAGVSKMNYKTFLKYNIIGAIFWVGGICFLGYFLGNITWIQKNFSKIVMAIIIITILPIVYGIYKQNFGKKIE